MSNIAEIQQRVPFDNKKRLLVQDHSTGDIVKAIKKYHGRYCNDYDKIAGDFWDHDPEHTANKLFAFLKKYIVYDIEPEDSQTIKSPGAIVQQMHGDCKHYASFITGVCCSLERQGKPIHACYRFVADSPDREIHHVFAVVTDKGTGRQYWVDPVLRRFNEQPKFHNIKDADMSSIGELYAISGTDATYPGGPENLPQIWGRGVGKKHKNNIFKKIAHGIQVDARNAGKEIKKDADKIKTIALKVGIAPARNSLLALLDLNAFNLATRFAQGWNNPAKHAGMVRTWKDIGGNEKKLRNAINNGIKHKAFVHHQAPAKRITGDLAHYLVARHRKGHRRNPFYVYHPNFFVPTLQHAYSLPPDSYGNHPKVSGIGIAPAAIPPMLAMASALIAAFQKFMKPSPADDAAMAHHAKEGVKKMIVDASDAIDAGDVSKGSEIMRDATQAQSLMNISTGTDPDTGQPVLQVNSVNHPQLNNAGTAIDPNADDPGSAGERGPVSRDPNALINIPANAGKDFMRDVIGPVKDEIGKIWAGYKVPIMFAVAGYGFYKFKTRKGSRKR